MGRYHTVVRLRTDSPYVGHRCPVRRKLLQLGDQVVICPERNVAITLAGWHEMQRAWEGNCPYCNQPAELVRLSTLPQVRDTAPSFPYSLNEPADKRRGTPIGLLIVAGIALLLGGRFVLGVLTAKQDTTTIDLKTENLEVTVSVADHSLGTGPTTIAVPTIAQSLSSLPSTPAAVPTPILTLTLTPSQTSILAQASSSPSMLESACPTPTLHRDLPGAHPNLGCPVSAWESDFTYQWFKQGLMVWRKSPIPSEIYILYKGGKWRSQIAPQGPPRPSCTEAENTGGLGPIFGFGVVWCAAEMERLGLPVTGEIASENSRVEQFQNGLAFRLGQDGYVLFVDNHWESFP